MTERDYEVKTAWQVAQEKLKADQNDNDDNNSDNQNPLQA